MSLRLGLLLAIAYVLVLAIVAFEMPIALSLRDRVDAEIRTQAASEADVLAAAAGPLLAPGRRAELGPVAATVARSVRGRVVVVDGSGRVVADSAWAARPGVSYATRPEIIEALAGRRYQKTRPSLTLGSRILATAAPVLRHGTIAGAVRVTQSVAAADRAVRRVTVDLALVGTIVLLLGLAVGAVIARLVSRPMQRLEAAARRIAGGDLDARAAVEGSTEQRSLTRSFNEMAERLGRALRSQRRFVADASHQLRTPLTGLRLRIEEAFAAGVPAAAAAVELEHGLREVDRLARTVEELLVLSQAGETDAPGEEVELAAVAHAALERWRQYAGERGIELAGDGAPSVVWCARADVDRALDALVENALGYSPPGTAVAVAAGEGRIEVRDEGPGLAPGEEDEVFERFRRGRGSLDGPPGSGLGLSIARELARRWGGEATLANRPGGGCCATLLFPRRDGP